MDRRHRGGRGVRRPHLGLRAAAHPPVGGALGGPRIVQAAGFAAAYLLGGGPAAASALTSFRRRELDVNILMVLAAVCAGAIGHWDEGAILLFLFSLSSSLGRWVQFGPNLPNALAFDLHYDAGDDVLLVGTMGRGAWTVAVRRMARNRCAGGLAGPRASPSRHPYLRAVD